MFTTTASSTVLQAPMNQLKFQAAQIIDATEFIPVTAEIVQNQMLVEATRRPTTQTMQQMVNEAVAAQMATLTAGSS